MVLLSELLACLRVKIPLEATTKEAVLRELVDVLAEDGCVEDPEPVLQVVRERESVLSTGIGHGVALPHGKTEACQELAIAAGVTTEPVDFAALDQEPVRLIFLLVGPESAAGPHIKALSRISHLVRRPEVRNALLDAESDEAFLRVMREAEAG